jgi:hypothetical protein
MNSLLSILTNRILWGFLGMTALAAVIWMIGPLLSVVDSRPLESEQNRIITIAVMYFIWVQSHIIPRLYNAWLNRKLMDNLKSDNAPKETADHKRLNSEEQILADRFEEASQVLKKRISTSRVSVAGNGPSVSARSTCISCPGMSSLVRRAPGKPPRWSTPGCNFRWPTNLAKRRCVGLAVRATVTGGLPMKPFCWTPPGVTAPRRASRRRMPANG